VTQSHACFIHFRNDRRLIQLSFPFVFVPQFPSSSARGVMKKTASAAHCRLTPEHCIQCRLERRPAGKWPPTCGTYHVCDDGNPNTRTDYVSSPVLTPARTLRTAVAMLTMSYQLLQLCRVQ
jgi:hypothetical protein